MPDRNEQFREVLSDLANALQAATPLATRQRRVLGDLAEEAVNLEAAIDRAVSALRRLHPPSGSTQGGGQ